MKFSLILVALVALFALTHADQESDVLDLTPSNFDSTVDGAEVILVEFFAPW